MIIIPYETRITQVIPSLLERRAPVIFRREVKQVTPVIKTYKSLHNELSLQRIVASGTVTNHRK